MNMNDISILDGIMESTATKRRWHMLSFYTRTLVILGIILYPLLISYIIYDFILTSLRQFDIFLFVMDLFFGTFIGLTFLGNWFLWKEKRNAILWGYFTPVVPVLFFLVITTIAAASNTASFIIRTIPPLALFAPLIFNLIKIRKRWKEEGVSSADLKKPLII